MSHGNAQATVVDIYVTERAGGELQPMAEVELVAGQGIRGDRYGSGAGTFSKKTHLPDRELTLIEIEEIDAFNQAEGTAFSPGQFRRNIVTRGVRLNDLVGRRFTVGDCEIEGIRLCEPCKYLGGLLVPEVQHNMAGRAGLRARIVSGGRVHRGDPVA